MHIAYDLIDEKKAVTLNRPNILFVVKEGVKLTKEQSYNAKIVPFDEKRIYDRIFGLFPNLSLPKQKKKEIRERLHELCELIKKHEGETLRNFLIFLRKRIFEEIYATLSPEVVYSKQLYYEDFATLSKLELTLQGMGKSLTQLHEHISNKALLEIFGNKFLYPFRISKDGERIFYKLENGKIMMEIDGKVHSMPLWKFLESVADGSTQLEVRVHVPLFVLANLGQLHVGGNLWRRYCMEAGLIEELVLFLTGDEEFAKEAQESLAHTTYYPNSFLPLKERDNTHMYLAFIYILAGKKAKRYFEEFLDKANLLEPEYHLSELLRTS